MRIAVLGSNGLLGSALVPQLQESGHAVLRHTRNGGGELSGDLTRHQEVAKALDGCSPEVIINLAALTNVDDCERSPQTAFLANVRIVENVASWIKRKGNGAHLIQISTDQLYDGKGPHKEDDITISNYYGFSKYAGELAAAAVPNTVLRTNFIGPSQCPGRRSLSDWIVQSLVNGDQITVFDDVCFSPLSLSRVVKLIELASTERKQGVFNIGSKDGITKADLAFALAETLGVSPAKVTRGNSNTVKLSASRPKDMSMDSSRFERAFGIELPTVRDVIQSMRAAYPNEAR